MRELRVSLFLICMVILQAGCAAYHCTVRGNAPDEVKRLFIGTWEGEHVDQEGNLMRTWIQRRAEDGTYAITFAHYSEKGIRKSGQRGKWWIEGDRFYEIDPDAMEDPDVYQFEILNENEIRFKSITTDYEFIDKRAQDLRDVTFI
ncbi:MAG: hypothetical protein SWQ30_20440 [Thermodesulfobacteriota bacterium]|nr:hypothetical protein [Thermodesulfobacteriota bacterium]